nr:MAG TPA: hypothetical protein [Bacteriophage sp.]DAT25782.1 MAG TPA: hypothetical protein [Caudoviricetes sp.]
MVFNWLTKTEMHYTEIFRNIHLRIFMKDNN